jgi:hypothetical protein
MQEEMLVIVRRVEWQGRRAHVRSSPDEVRYGYLRPCLFIKVVCEGPPRQLLVQALHHTVLQQHIRDVGRVIPLRPAARYSLPCRRRYAGRGGACAGVDDKWSSGNHLKMAAADAKVGRCADVGPVARRVQVTPASSTRAVGWRPCWTSSVRVAVGVDGTLVEARSVLLCGGGHTSTTCVRNKRWSHRSERVRGWGRA